MKPYWVLFYDRPSGTIFAPTQIDAIKEAATHGKVVQADVLPYPASPILNDGEFYITCHSPERCKGRTSCPRLIACSE